MRVKSLLSILLAAVLAVGGTVAITSAQTGGGASVPRPPLFKSLATPGHITELKTHAHAAKGAKRGRIAYRFARPVKIPANNGRFVRLACPEHSSAINFQQITGARDIYVDYSAVALGSHRKWVVGFENLNSSGTATVRAGVVCASN